MANNENNGGQTGISFDKTQVPGVEQQDIFKGIEENPGFHKKETPKDVPCLIKVIGITPTVRP